MPVLRSLALPLAAAPVAEACTRVIYSGAEGWVCGATLSMWCPRDLRMLDLGLDMTNLQSGEVSGQFAAAAPFRFEAAE